MKSFYFRIPPSHITNVPFAALYSDQEGPLKCDIEKGLLVLPRNWTGGAGVSCGYNHCVVHAVNNSKPEGRAYVAGSNSHFQLGHGGSSSGGLKVVRGLVARNVTAIFSAANQTYAADKEGRLPVSEMDGAMPTTRNR